MESINNETETLAEEIKQVLAEQPHVESLLNAFGPILLEKSRWLAEVQNYKKTFPVDAIQYEGGISLIQQCQLFLPEDLSGKVQAWLLPRASVKVFLIWPKI